MPMRLGRLQRQSRRAFRASAAPEVSTSELAGWCWARQTLMEARALTLATRIDDPSWRGQPPLTASLGGGRAGLERAVTRALQNVADLHRRPFTTADSLDAARR